jgi:hypothetical protein
VNAVPRAGLFVGLIALIALVAFTVHTLTTPGHRLSGIPPGEKLPPFAAPLALSDLYGAVNVATGPNQGQAGKVPACTVRESRVLNICQEAEHDPVVLALFVDGSACTGVLPEMQQLKAEYPQVRFTAVALKGERGALRKTIAKLHLSYPVGIDEEGVLAALYGVASCPQVSFVLPGRTVQSRALLVTPTLAELRRRVAALVAAAHAG